jgi:phosphoglycerate dehydrogenase-like enzyme
VWLATAFDMRVIGIPSDPSAGAGHADAVHAMSDLNALLPRADFIALTCPLTAETEKLIDADALGRMKPSAYLLNAARGRVVDEPALVDVLARRQIRGAALDVTVEEPLPAASPLWAMENVLITPHTAGETCRYEDDVLAIMQENLARLWRGETELLNQVKMIVFASGPSVSFPKRLAKKEGDERVERSPRPTRAVLSGPFPWGEAERQ